MGRKVAVAALTAAVVFALTWVWLTLLRAAMEALYS